MSYTNNHKMLLQTFVHEGIVTGDRVKDFVIKVFGDDRVPKIINEINKQLEPLNMLIKRVLCELTGQVYWVLTDTVLNKIERYQDEFSKPQLALLRNIFSGIIASETGFLTSTDCLNLAMQDDVKLSKIEAEKFLNSIVERKWLFSVAGNFHMGTRGAAELLPYFREAYGDNLNTCKFCRQIIFYGHRCDHCGTPMHLYCLKNFVKLQTSVKCPSCANPVTTPDLSDVIDASATLNEPRSSRAKRT